MSMWEFYEAKDIKATRKEHRCEECGLIIPIKTACIYVSGKFDGSMVSNHSHHECHKKLQDINIGADEDNWLMLNEMQEAYPHEKFSDWKDTIREKYNLGD